MEKQFLFLALFLLKICVRISDGFLSENQYEWTHHIKLPSGIEVRWIHTDPEYITFQMRGPERGYISIGFSPNGGMSGADMFVGWVDSKGQGHLLDMHGTHNGQPILDSSQDLELLGAKEDDTGTSIIFRRKWDTCDEPQDFHIRDDTVRLIWATSPNDPVETLHGYTPSYHGHDFLSRGVRSAFMKVLPQHRPFPDKEDVYPSNVFHVDLGVSEVVVPKVEMYYHCRIVKLPKLQSKHHIIGYRPIIAPESVPHLHHISLYKCHIPQILKLSEEDVFEKYVDQHGGDCYTEASPPEWTKYCFEFRMATGVGDEGHMLPDHLGDLIGGDTDVPSYFRVEAHYENPEGKDLIDSSALRVFYTSTLRKYEIAYLWAGHRRTPFLTIPPHQESYTSYSFCGAECTQKGLPKEGIKIISLLLHAHLTGKGITLRHIRNGKELPPIAQDNHVDFNYQHYRTLKEERTVLPGDELISECTYHTETNDTFIYGGLSTRREMCELFIIFYPKTTLIDCRSQPEFYDYFQAIGVENVTGGMLNQLQLPFNSNLLPKEMQDDSFPDDSMAIENGRANDITHDLFRDVKITKPKNLEGMDAHKYMMSLNWDDKEFVKSVEQKRKSGGHYMHCNAPGGKKIRTSRDVYQFPVYEVYEAPKKACLSRSSASDATMKLSSSFMLFATVSFLVATVKIYYE
ncbi:unnamed protein product [Orchesella dallaii]|uniref:DOMON domain-containing protein n=1 Tax=Orchesella dallaii TaxID=48710 RepID=A0ABP1Q7L1_9HEXA